MENPLIHRYKIVGIAGIASIYKGTMASSMESPFVSMVTWMIWDAITHFVFFEYMLGVKSPVLTHHPTGEFRTFSRKSRKTGKPMW